MLNLKQDEETHTLKQKKKEEREKEKQAGDMQARRTPRRTPTAHCRPALLTAPF